MNQLYQQLKELVASTEAFYMVEQEWMGQVFEVFTYRMASYTEFLLPGALECRGHTFLNGELVSLPMQKFFNLGENPMTMNLDLSRVFRIQDKLDGSLISTCRTDLALPWFTLKSKTSFTSPQAVAANELLDTADYRILRDFCERCVNSGYTVNMEYCAPDNRIVVGYDEPMLKVLNVRRHSDGEYVARDILEVELGNVFLAGVQTVPSNINEWVESVYNMSGIEGFVCTMTDGLMFKMKTNEYATLHRAKDSVTVPRRLWEVCVTGGADDLRQLFKTDPSAVEMIDEMEQKAVKTYNHLAASVEAYYNENKGLSQKDYAIKGQQEFTNKGEFGLVMALYHGKSVDYAEFLCKNWKSYGISDEEVEIC